MEYDLQVTVGGEVLLFGSLMVDETERVAMLTSYKNKKELAQACWNEEPAAQKAVYIICKARNGETVRWADAKFKDDVTCKYVDPAGRHVALKVEQNEDGSAVLDDDGDPKPLMRDGLPVLIYVDTGEEVPPTEDEAVPPTSDTPEKPSSDGDTATGTPPTELS